MNIDYLANLIESCDVSAFRTIASVFLRSLGYAGFLSDGPYDGGADFFVHENAESKIKTAFQLSIEKDWRGKIKKEIAHAKRNYPEIRTFIFITKRRVPRNSIQKLNVELIHEHGFPAIHYDNQAIATELIAKNLVHTLYETLNIKALPEPPAAVTTPKIEAASAILLFGAAAGDFRAAMTENLLLAEIHRIQPVEETTFFDDFLKKHSFDVLQKPEFLKAVRRSINDGKIVIENSKLVVSQAASEQLEGMKSLAMGEFEELRQKVFAYIKACPLEKHEAVAEALLENLLSLSQALWLRMTPGSGVRSSPAAEEAFHKLSGMLAASLGLAASKKLLADIADLVADSDFAKKMASAELFYSLLHTKSTQLVAALGASKGLLVLLDTQVVIPILCGLLFDKIQDHSAYSARLLCDLLTKHKFTAVAPAQYVNEAAGHLIKCCREYQALILAGEDLSLSNNAFASHYSQLRKNGSALSFNDYIAVFGAPKGDRYGDLSDAFFYPAIQKIQARLTELLGRYQIDTLSLDQRRFQGNESRIGNSLNPGEIRAPLLVEHDARVIGYLEGPEVSAGWAKVLCTWDSMHFRLNPDWDSYCVMNPATVTDLLTIIRADDDGYPMAQLVDYVWLQNEASSRLSAEIWDEIVELEKGKLADAALLAKARAFRQDFIDSHPANVDLENGEIASLWLKWRGE